MTIWWGCIDKILIVDSVNKLPPAPIKACFQQKAVAPSRIAEPQNYGAKFVPQLALINGRAAAHCAAVIPVPAVVAAPLNPSIARSSTSPSLLPVSSVSPSMSRLHDVNCVPVLTANLPTAPPMCTLLCVATFSAEAEVWRTQTN